MGLKIGLLTYYRDSTKVWLCNTLEKKIFKTLYFLVTNVFHVSKLILWYLNMSSIDLSIRFKVGMYLWNRENRLNAFLISTDIIQVLNELQTDKIHIKVPQDRLLCPTHVHNKKKTGFRKISF